MKRSKKKVFIVTGNRAEYDLLYWLLKEIKNNQDYFDHKLIVTGNHYSKKYGFTFKNIKKDGFKIDYSIKLPFFKDDAQDLIDNFSKILNKSFKIFKKDKPDFLILLGDRYEILPIAISSLFNGIPICHLNGGENTENSFDDYIRNCVTKLSYFHFPANNVYKKNIIQMGERPNRVFMAGSLSQDQVRKFKLISKNKLQRDLKFSFKEKNVLITYHPETIENKNNIRNIKNILDVLTNLKNTNLFFTYPNSDPQSEMIIKELNDRKNLKLGNSKIFIFKTLGRSKYLSLMKYSDFVIGNSSSGILEAPLMNKISVNLGDRQKGRIKAPTVYDCNINKKKMIDLISLIYKKKNRIKNKVLIKTSPAKQIVKILKKIKIPKDIKKKFYNI